MNCPKCNNPMKHKIAHSKKYADFEMTGRYICSSCDIHIKVTGKNGMFINV